ncbi:MAG: hypothetical protein C0467_30105 [Planctomycetaceae bacterium]|nr:hypothetical protein [Planctomycetaceae bacterium]
MNQLGGEATELSPAQSIIKQALQQLPEKQHLVATVARTLHTYTNTVKILCDAFRIEFENPPIGVKSNSSSKRSL